MKLLRCYLKMSKCLIELIEHLKFKKAGYLRREKVLSLSSNKNNLRYYNKVFNSKKKKCYLKIFFKKVVK